ncbi:MAG: 8-amino-7-oxononanoate synthase [Betaproteobacteria bacterium]|nr:8-amino-7-oxononanoate synthase [Betaproteobacteria bacterium]
MDKRVGLIDMLAAELAELEAQGLKRRRRTLEMPSRAHMMLDGHPVISFCNNDYLGLAGHTDLIHASRDAAVEAGVGAGSAHLVAGHHRLHAQLEKELADFVGMQDALLFSTGYMANIGAVTALVGRGDAVFGDKLNHASLVDACLLSRAELTRYPHGDLDFLEAKLKVSTARRKLVATDAVFSMDGDIAPLPELLALCERYDAWLLVDDAHGFGVLGEHGRGVLEHFATRHSPLATRLIYMATLGKAAGVFGAFVAGHPTLIEWLVNKARTYVYTTATPPMLAAAVSTSLKLIAADDWRRIRLKELIAQLREGMAGQPWTLMESNTPIQPLVVGDNATALRLAEALRERGVMVPAIRPPTVPQGTARLRISLSAAHAAADVERLLATLRDLAG